MCIFAAMNENILPIHFAPLQGYIVVVSRREHARIFVVLEFFYSLFARLEHGEIRPTYTLDIRPVDNIAMHIIPKLTPPGLYSLEYILSLFIDN